MRRAVRRPRRPSPRRSTGVRPRALSPRLIGTGGVSTLSSTPSTVTAPTMIARPVSSTSSEDDAVRAAVPGTAPTSIHGNASAVTRVVLSGECRDGHRERDQHESERQRLGDDDRDERCGEEVEAEADRALDHGAHEHRGRGDHEVERGDVHAVGGAQAGLMKTCVVTVWEIRWPSARSFWRTCTWASLSTGMRRSSRTLLSPSPSPSELSSSTSSPVPGSV